MRCVAICAAKEYRLYGITNFFKKQAYTTKLYDKMIHVTDADSTHDIFIFSYGCVVIWGLKHFQEQEILTQIESFATDPLPAARYKHFVFRQGTTTDITATGKLNIDIITLESTDIKIKLAISLGLAQSVKLEYYEERVQGVIDKSVHLPAELSKQGKIKLSNKAIAQHVGEIFTVRSSINLSSIYLEPEHFLERFNIDHYYQLTKKALHIPRRVNMLNQKLHVLYELLEMLKSQLQYRLGTFLKFIATFLVVMQVLIGLTQLIQA